MNYKEVWSMGKPTEEELKEAENNPKKRVVLNEQGEKVILDKMQG